MKALARSVSTLLVSAGLYAQPPAQPSQTIKIGGITLTGSLRARVYFWDWFNPPPAKTATSTRVIFFGSDSRNGPTPGIGTPNLPRRFC